MSEIILTCANVSLPDAMNELTIPDGAVMFLERVPTRWLDNAEITDGLRLTAYEAGTDWKTWARGRVFCPEWELRWEGARAVYIGVTTTLPNFVAGPDLSPCTRRETRYYLWGQRDGSRFIELQVARVLIYPITTGTRVKLRVAEWFDTAGEMAASRCIGLEGAV